MACPHGMPKPSTCIDCMNEDGLGSAPETAVTVEHVFSAGYDGHCRPCDLPIVVGQSIAAMSDGSYRHEACA